MNYLKISKAIELSGWDKIIYRLLEILPGFLSVGTLSLLIIFSFFRPVWVAYFIIAFDVYYFLLIIFLATYLIISYRKMKVNRAIDWSEKCASLPLEAKSPTSAISDHCLARQGWSWTDLVHLIILPTYNESLEVIRSSFIGLMNNGYPSREMIVVLAMEERAGEPARVKAEAIRREFGDSFRHLFISFHPDNIVGELKGKGANQAYAGKLVKEKIIDPEQIPYEKIIVSVFDIDTVATRNYFYCLSYRFLTIDRPHRASYQPVPIYHNNVWQTPFFARVSAASNTFWQMMQQIRPEKLATYSSHSMTFKALVEIGFWAPNMVSEDSRIFWHCYLYYNGDYRVEPLYFPVSMDATCDQTFWQTVKSLYKQQRRWAWGSENIPYLIFNYWKKRKEMKIGPAWRHIWIQIYGFYSWATTALIIGLVGWFPMLLGGDRFNSTVMALNLPDITSRLMTVSMVGMFISAVVASLLLPKRPAHYGFFDNVKLFLEWIFVPVSVIFFGAIPCLDAQIRLMLGKYMGFWVTPKVR